MVKTGHRKRALKMTSEPQTKTHPHHAPDKHVFNAAGVLCEFLASPEEVGNTICLIRGTMPPGDSSDEAGLVDGRRSK